MIDALKIEGPTSAYAVAHELDARSIATAREGKWTVRSVLSMTAALGWRMAACSLTAVETTVASERSCLAGARTLPGETATRIGNARWRWS
jgi:hypothetical protein